MNPNVSKIILITATGVFICIAAYRPEWTSDKNGFLKNFVGPDFLNILGVILTITLASLSQLHLSLGKFRDDLGKEGLHEIRTEIKNSAAWLIAGFLFGLLLIFIKPLVPAGQTGQALINSLCLDILLFYVLVLSDITLSIFDIELGEKD